MVKRLQRWEGSADQKMSGVVKGERLVEGRCLEGLVLYSGEVAF